MLQQHLQIFFLAEIGTSVHEGSVTCPLDVSELEPTDNDRTYADDLSDTDTKLIVSVLIWVCRLFSQCSFICRCQKVR